MNIIKKVEAAISDLRSGKMIILVDNEDRENEGDLILAADKVTPETINFMSKYARGLICLSMAGEEIDRLQIPMMAKKNTSKLDTAFTVSIEAAVGVTTGISAADRAHTILTAINPNSTHDDIVMPGHIFPLRAKAKGVMERDGHTEGSIDLARLAGLRPAAVLCEVMNDDGSMARMPDLKKFAKEHDLKLISIEELKTYRLATESFIEEVSSARIPVKHLGEFVIKVFEDKVNDLQHVVLIKGEIERNDNNLVRIHSECLTGDLFGSERCDCGWQFNTALSQIAKHGGIMLYMRQEGRGIGLANKIKAYALQDQGYDTIEANAKLGFSPDQREYGISAQILKTLGATKVTLLTNNPDKIQALKQNGIIVTARNALEMPSNETTAENVTYLKTKRDKLGHLLELVEG